ncbi:hypothetical protein QE388_002556 [Microbacterium sp. SORGH_AS 969]|nr:hypothetical protein [Microbacterium sp. SORGH_AS_0969]
MRDDHHLVRTGLACGREEPRGVGEVQVVAERDLDLELGGEGLGGGRRAESGARQQHLGAHTPAAHRSRDLGSVATTALVERTVVVGKALVGPVGLRVPRQHQLDHRSSASRRCRGFEEPPAFHRDNDIVGLRHRPGAGAVGVWRAAAP